MMGTSAIQGTLRVIVVSDEVIMPPKTTVLPLATLTDASARVMSLMGDWMEPPPHRAQQGYAAGQLVLAFLGVSLQGDHAIRRDARLHGEDDARVVVGDDGLDRSQGARRRAGDDGDALADLDRGQAVVERTDLRAAQDVDRLLVREGPQQGAHRFGAGGQHQSAEAERVVDAAQSQVGEFLRADLRRPL